MYSPLFFQIVHKLFGARGVPAAYLEQKPFEVGRDEDIHRGRSRFIEVAVGIVLAACKEVGEDIVHIGSAVQAPYGQSHTLCVVRGEYVAEVARGNGKVYTLAHLYLPAAHQIEVGREIVGYLRRKSAEVYGVGGRKYDVLFFQNFGILFA